MSLFKSLFNMSKEKEGYAIARLCHAIYDSSFALSDGFIELSGCSEAGEKNKMTHLLFEFLFFFLHLTERVVYNKVDNNLRGNLIDTMTAVLFNHTLKFHLKGGSQETEVRLEKFFYKKAYEASLDYANCVVPLSEENPFSSDKALFSKLAIRVSMVLGGGNRNPVMLQNIVMISLGMWDEMNFSRLIDAAVKDKLIHSL